MKSTYYLSVVFIFICISSCSNGVLEINDEENGKIIYSNRLGTTSIVLDNDTLSLKSFFPKIDTLLVEKDSFNITDIPLATRIIDDNIIPLTFTGCQTFTQPIKNKIYNMTFAKDIADALGLNHTYSYQCYLYLAQLRVGYPSGMFPVESISPQCGYKPGQSTISPVRGYELQLVPGANSFVLSTYIFSVIRANENTTLLNDVWAPCKSADIIWNVGLK